MFRIVATNLLTIIGSSLGVTANLAVLVLGVLLEDLLIGVAVGNEKVVGRTSVDGLELTKIEDVRKRNLSPSKVLVPVA